VRRPNFFIVGAPKCGTTALETYLGRHPDVFMCPLVEPHYFGTDLPFGGRAPFDEGDYLSLFANARDQRRVGEKSVWYLYSKRAAVEIKTFDPGARIIVMLRNPVDQMHALHGECRFQGSEHIKDFEAALRAEPARRQGLGLPPRGMREACLYSAVARYPEQLARYFEVFGRENVHVIIFDDLRAHAASVYRSTLAFLDLPPAADIDLRPENTSHQPRSDRVARMIHEPPQLLRRLVRAILPLPARVRVTTRLRRLNRREAPRSPMSAELRRRLQAQFAGDVERLGEMLGRDLTHWSRG
jgi:hypothetical protein